MIPIRLLFRSRWLALAWAASICLSAASFVGERKSENVDAAQAATGLAAEASALGAEDAG